MLFFYDIKAEGNAELGKRSNFDAALLFELEEDKVSVAGLDDGLAVSIGALVTTSSS